MPITAQYPTRNYTTINDMTDEELQQQQEKKRTQQLREKWFDWCRQISISIGIVILCIAMLVVAIGLLSVLYVAVGEFVQNTITEIFGKTVYNKYFPVCSVSNYNNLNGCYTTTSVYCT